MDEQTRDRLAAAANDAATRWATATGGMLILHPLAYHYDVADAVVAEFVRLARARIAEDTTYAQPTPADPWNRGFDAAIGYVLEQVLPDPDETEEDG